MKQYVMKKLAQLCLPEWVRLRLERENDHLAGRIQKLQQEIERLNAYIDGMEQAMRMRAKVVVQAGGKE